MRILLILLLFICNAQAGERGGTDREPTLDNVGIGTSPSSTYRVNISETRTPTNGIIDSCFRSDWIPTSWPANSTVTNVHGYIYNSGSDTSATTHGIGVFGKAEDTASGQLMMIGSEGFVLGRGNANYWGAVGHSQYAHDTTMSASNFAGLYVLSEILQTDLSTALNDGINHGVYVEALKGGSTKIGIRAHDELRVYDSTKTKYVSLDHNDTDARIETSSGAFGFVSPGLINFISSGTNANSFYVDNETFAPYHVFQTTSSDQFYFVPSVINAAGVKIGADSTDNLIDDASNGSSSTTLYIGNETIDTTASDRRLKTNIEPSTIDPFKLFNSINIVDFDWINGSNKGLGKLTAMIAQDAYKTIPQYVVKPDNPDNNWSIKYDYLVGPLILAMQKLEKRVIELEACNG